MENQETIKEKQNSSALLVPGSIVLAGAIIALAVVYSNGGSVATSPDKTGQDKGDNAAKIEDTVAAQDVLSVKDGDFILGNPSAPVTLYEFADFQCPFCSHFFSGTLSQIKEKYIKSGQVKLVWRDFAFLGQESLDAAAAAKCAGEQGRFWDYHDYLFTHQQGENQGAFSVNNLKSFATTLSLNSQNFADCLDSGKYQKQASENTQKAASLGVNGTPTSVINGQMIVGAQPLSEFETIIKPILEK